MSIKTNIKTMDELESAIKSANLLKKYNLDRIGVYGSFARGEKDPNDIDIYIDKDDCSLESLLNLKIELEKISGKKIDMMIKRYAEPIILHRAKKDMKYFTQ